MHVQAAKEKIGKAVYLASSLSEALSLPCLFRLAVEALLTAMVLDMQPSEISPLQPSHLTPQLVVADTSFYTSSTEPQENPHYHDSLPCQTCII